MSSRRIRYHEQELRRLLAFVGIFGGMSAATYIVPGLDLVQPWVLGEPVPLVHLALDRAIVTENHLGEIVRKMPGEGIVEEESPADRDSGRARLAESPAGPLPEADAPASAAEEPPAEPPVVDALAVTFPLPDDCDSTSPWAIYVQSSDADPWDLDHGRWSGPHAEPVPWVSQVARLAARAEEAAAQNTYVAAHAYTARGANRALECGIRSIEHGNLIDDSTFDLLLAKNAFLVPTMSTHEVLAEQGVENGMPKDMCDKVFEVAEAGHRTHAAAHARGVNMVFGTDLLGPMHQHQLREFKIRSAFQTPAELIRSATIKAAELFQMEGEIGEIIDGARADLIAYDRNPLEDISVLQAPEQHLKLIMKDGRIYKDAL